MLSLLPGRIFLTRSGTASLENALALLVVVTALLRVAVALMLAALLGLAALAGHLRLLLLTALAALSRLRPVLGILLLLVLITVGHVTCSMSPEVTTSTTCAGSCLAVNIPAAAQVTLCNNAALL